MNILGFLFSKELVVPSAHAQPASWQEWVSITLKRGFDICVALLGLVVLAPVFFLIAIVIRLNSPGPAFYRGPRVGWQGKPFGILKFRTMYERPQSYQGPRVTANGDARITPLGKWLRDTKLNELPQLWNVLVGEMSLVGPRPEDPTFVATWPEEVKREILSMRPGITSPASVSYRDEERRLNASSVMADYLEHIQPDKLRLDRMYVRHHSFMSDLDAIFWTVVILIPRLKEKKIPEGWLFGGPFSRLKRSYFNWFVTDFILAFFSVGLTGLLWRISSPLDVGLVWAVVMSVFLAFLFGLFNTLLGLRRVSWSHAAAEDVILLFVSCGLVILVEAGLHFLNPSVFGLPGRFVFTASLVVLLGCVIARYRFRLLTGLASRWITLRGSGYGVGERVLIVGAGEGGSLAAFLLRRGDFRRLYSIVGIVDDDLNKQHMRYDGFKVLGTTTDIPRLVRDLDIGVIFYAISKISKVDSERILSECRKTRVKLVIISDLIKGLHDQLSRGPESFQGEGTSINLKTRSRPEGIYQQDLG